MNLKFAVSSAIIVACFLSSGFESAHAATIIAPPTYLDFAREADVVVLAEAVTSEGRSTQGLVFTETEFEIVDDLTASLENGESLTVRVPGGVTESRFWIVPGAPTFRAGDRYLLALRERDDGNWAPLMLSYGVFVESNTDDGSSLLSPIGELHKNAVNLDGSTTEVLVPVERDAFLGSLRSRLRPATPDREKIPDDSSWSIGSFEASLPEGGGADVPPECSFIGANGTNFRWAAFDQGNAATIRSNTAGERSLPGNGFPLVQEALDMWMDISDTSFNLRYGGAEAPSLRCSGGTDVVENFILFGDPCSDIEDLENCRGVLAFAGPNGNFRHSFDGEDWYTATTWVCVVNNGTGCVGTANFRVVLAHEFGHGLGFGHVEDDGALMFANCCRNVNSTDRSCARFAYPAISPTNARPEVDAGPDRSVVLLGDEVPLRGSASDDDEPAGRELVSQWRRLVGPGQVTFEDESSLETVARFSHSGTYLLALEVYDGERLAIDNVSLDVRIFAGNDAELVFQQGRDGYSGTVDTFLYEGESDTSNANAPSLDVDEESPGGSGFAKQSLLRFEDIFQTDENQDPSAISPGAPIRSAFLELRTTNSGDGARLHRMTRDWDDSATWDSVGGGLRAGTHGHSQPDATASGASDPSVVDVTTSLHEWSRRPETNLGWMFLPIGSDGWDFDSAEGEEPPLLRVSLPNVEPLSLVEPGDTWRYIEGRSAPRQGWNDLDFDDSRWFEGPTGIGFGDDDDHTIIVDMPGRFATIFCRTEFTLEGPFDASDLELTVDYDDGFVAYLNGVELVRANVAGDGSEVTHETLADLQHEAGTPETFHIPTTALQRGRNVIAFSVHNATIGSGDLSFIPALRGHRVLVDARRVWKYQPGSHPPGDEWTSVDFDDSAWSEGRGSIGYGGGDDFTELLDMQGNYAAVFCRTTFELDCAEEIDALRLNAVIDDGAVVYINGEEVARINMPNGEITADTLAASPSDGLRSVELPVDNLRPGRNVLAVSVHNASLGNADLGFVATLVPTIRTFEDDSPCDVPPEPQPEFVRGDAQPDGRLNVSDAVRLLTVLFRGGDALECEDAADADDDGTLSLTDAITILNFLFQASDPLPPPSGECGPDPTEDDLAECALAKC